jgi:hypothetical protein
MTGHDRVVVGRTCRSAGKPGHDHPGRPARSGIACNQRALRLPPRPETRGPRPKLYVKEHLRCHCTGVPPAAGRTPPVRSVRRTATVAALSTINQPLSTSPNIYTIMKIARTIFTFFAFCGRRREEAQNRRFTCRVGFLARRFWRLSSRQFNPTPGVSRLNPRLAPGLCRRRSQESFSVLLPNLCFPWFLVAVRQYYVPIAHHRRPASPHKPNYTHPCHPPSTA